MAPITALTPAQSARCRRIRHVRHVQHVRQEYRRYPVVDNEGQNWEEMGRYFSCNSVWMTSRLVDKCCHVPRCACCTKDGTTHGMYSHVPPTVSPLASPLLALVAPTPSPFLSLLPCNTPGLSLGHPAVTQAVIVITSPYLPHRPLFLTALSSSPPSLPHSLPPPLPPSLPPSHTHTLMDARDEKVALIFTFGLGFSV